MIRCLGEVPWRRLGRCAARGGGGGSQQRDRESHRSPTRVARPPSTLVTQQAELEAMMQRSADCWGPPTRGGARRRRSVGPEPGGAGRHLVDALGGARFVLVHEVGQFVGLGTVVARLRSDYTHPGDVGDVIHRRVRPRAWLRVPTPLMRSGFCSSVRHWIRTVRPAAPRAPGPPLCHADRPPAPADDGAVGAQPARMGHAGGDGGVLPVGRGRLPGGLGGRFGLFDGLFDRLGAGRDAPVPGKLNMGAVRWAGRWVRARWAGSRWVGRPARSPAPRRSIPSR